MVSRELLRFKWIYDEGVITLVDKQKGISFSLPISYLDSFVRASITFKNAHRNELLDRKQKRVMVLQEHAKQMRKQRKLI